jgi:hypothetical protein
MNNNNDTYSYKGWLNSDHFIKRVVAVFLYGLVAQLIISVGFFILFMIFGMMLIPLMFAGM